MASIKKFKYSAVKPLLRHCAREIKNPSNKDINPALSHKNYSLLPKRTITDYEYFLSIIHANDVSYWHRADTVALVGVVISFPLSSCDEETEREFFEMCVSFLNVRYSERFAVQAIVHVDESQNNLSVKGRHHLHYNFVPCIKNENKRRNTEWQVCASKLLTPVEFRSFHSDLQTFLLEHGINEYIVSKVKYGIVKNNGRNFSVKELKSDAYNRRRNRGKEY